MSHNFYYEVQEIGKRAFTGVVEFCETYEEALRDIFRTHGANLKRPDGITDSVVHVWAAGERKECWRIRFGLIGLKIDRLKDQAPVGFFVDPRIQPCVAATFDAFVESKMKLTHSGVSSHGILKEAVMSLCEEAGEVARAVKKDVWRHEVPDKANILEECGDVLFNVVAIAHEYGFTLREVIERNIEKLTKRHPGVNDV